MMKRLILSLVFLAVGFALGVWFERGLMRKECAAGAGQWTGTICLNSDLLQ
jgi:hypothetical protein